MGKESLYFCYGLVTKMVAVPLYGKKPKKIFFSRTTGSIALKLVCSIWLVSPFEIYINDDSGPLGF